MNNNNIEPIKCPACFLTFDTDKHLPRISPACGHTLCKECLIQVLKMDTPRCPLDKLKFGKDFRTIDVFPTNFLGKDLLEIRGKWNICESHQEQQKMICLADHTLVCGSCVLFGDHKGHKVKKLEHFEEIFNQKKAQLSAVSERVSKVSCEFTNDLDEKKRSMKKAIKNRFQSLYVEIQKQELSMLLELENMFCDAERKLKTSIDMPFDIENKLKQFDEIMLNPNIAKLAEEDFSDLDKILEEKLTSWKIKHTEEIAELFNLFQNNLPKEDLLKDLDIIGPLGREIALLTEKNLLVIEAKEIIIPPIELKIVKKSENGSLTLSVRGSDTPKSCTLSKADLDEITKVAYDFEFDNDIIDERIFSTILLFSRSLKNLKTVTLAADAPLSFEGPCEAKFFHLLSIIFSQLNENLEEIDIYVKKASVKDLGIRNFVENFLPRFKNLKEFSLTLNQTETTSKALKAFSKVDFSQHRNLQKFNVDLRKCPLDEEEEVIEFLKRIPNVKNLFLGFGASPLTDNAFDSFSTNIIPSLTNLESLELGFWKTNITDEGVEKLLNNIPNVKILDISLSCTNITDAGVRDFIENKLPTFTNLKDFGLHLKETQVSKGLLDEVRKWERKFKRNDESEEEKSGEKLEEDDDDDDEGEQEQEYDPFKYVI